MLKDQIRRSSGFLRVAGNKQAIDQQAETKTSFSRSEMGTEDPDLTNAWEEL